MRLDTYRRAHLGRKFPGPRLGIRRFLAALLPFPPAARRPRSRGRGCRLGLGRGSCGERPGVQACAVACVSLRGMAVCLSQLLLQSWSAPDTHASS